MESLLGGGQSQLQNVIETDKGFFLVLTKPAVITFSIVSCRSSWQHVSEGE